ncbi:ice-binding protein [Gillisia sp. CAL575]|uniref:ice-binding protein n=1 Tax=Gillisia sp. CAL575 TaxID=985255 RepID=UPI00039D8144|nr:ice-binding protein [Gillisia sp. CAL575]
MKFKIILPALVFVFIGLFSSCEKDELNDNSADMKASAENTVDLSSDISSKKSDDTKEQGTLKVVNLGVAGDFAILTKTGITSVYKSSITGDIGTSPITGAAMVLDCGEVTGNVYSVDAAGPACITTSASMLTTAISNMETAYTDAAGRTTPDFVNLGAGNIGGKTLTPGLYKFTSSVVIPTDIALAGGPDDVWIFQVSGNLDMSSAVRVTLSGGAQAKNIFWQVAGAVNFGTTSHFEGNILGQTGINLKTGASINGRLLAQTAATLQKNTVTQPK